MTNKKTARRALFTSVISLILCCAMLVGTTFAWFTDEVVTGMNTIAAGNLDVELLADGQKVDSATKLFDDVTLWEPGVVVYENLQVANVGSLALKYQMTLNFGNENNLNGHKLSEVLQVAIIDKVGAGAERSDVMAAAEAAIAASGRDASLGNFVLNGELEAGASTEEQAIVIFWAPSDNAVDNLYNANNGQITSDGKDLHIEFGINLQATQLTFEEDSFGKDYDEFASILPKATVNNVSATYANINATAGIGGTAESMPLDFALQFLPNETLEEAMTSDYKYYNVDFVIKADKDVPANSMALAGYYTAWCDFANNGNWVALSSPDAIAANTEIRLVDAMGGGSIKVSYKDICQYAVDGDDSTPDGFLCGATDLTGENAGTTITVELRAYETTSDPTDSSNTGVEVGPDAYEVVGVYSYTFPMPAVEVSDATELQSALNAGKGNIVLADGEYKMPSSNTSGNITITGNEDTVLDMTKGAYMDSANVTIKGVTIKTSTGYVMDDAGNKGSDYAALYTPNVTYINCVFEGPMRVGRDGAKFINCTFNNLGNDYIWTYGNDVTFEGCTFNTDGKAILIYSDGGNEVSQVTVKNCTFNSTTGAKAGAIANQNCAAIEIHNYGNGVNLTTSGNTYDSNFSGEWRIKTYEAGRTQVFVNGVEYTTIAIDGKTMTIDADKNVTVNP